MRIGRFIPLLLLFSFCLNTSTNLLLAQQKNGPYDSLAAGILRLINEHRTEMALKPLVMNKAISNVAAGHSRNMATEKVPFGHKGFDDRMDLLAEKLKPTSSFAENVAYGATTADEAYDLWINSPGHRQNIEGDFNLTGIGIVKSKSGDLYYTQIFVKKGN